MRLHWLLIGLVFGLLCVQLPAGAACAAPELTTVDVVQPGETVRVHGVSFAAACNDTGNGCSGPGRSPPSRDIRLELRGDDETVFTTTVDADSDYQFTADLLVPADVASGTTFTVVATTDKGGETVSDPITVADD